jgi:transcriptional regulator with PAS, ATPase and Fis domain
MEKAKSFSNSIIETSDNAIVVVDESFKIQLANPAFLAMVKMEATSDLVGKDLGSILDTDLYSLALGGTPIKDKKIYLPSYGKYLSSTIAYDEHYHIIIGVYRDVTSIEKRRQNEAEIAEKTAKITTDVIEKNMRAVQEIASLLGESTAETKVALTQLKDVLKKGEDDDD